MIYRDSKANYFVFFDRLLLMSSLFILVGCSSDINDKSVKVDNKVSIDQSVKYAKGFTIESFKDYKVVTINEAWKDVGETFKYVLYQHEKPVNIIGATFVNIPTLTIACMSLTHVSF